MTKCVADYPYDVLALAKASKTLLAIHIRENHIQLITNSISYGRGGDFNLIANRLGSI